MAADSMNSNQILWSSLFHSVDDSFHNQTLLHRVSSHGTCKQLRLYSFWRDESFLIYGKTWKNQSTPSNNSSNWFNVVIRRNLNESYKQIDFTIKFLCLLDSWCHITWSWSRLVWIRRVFNMGWTLVKIMVCFVSNSTGTIRNEIPVGWRHEAK